MKISQLNQAQKIDSAPGIRKWRSEELFMGRREILIEHRSALYRLMITKAGKLILNK